MFLKGQGGIVVKDMDKQNEHHHMYTDKDGKIHCHHKDEKTGIRTPSKKNPLNFENEFNHKA